MAPNSNENTQKVRNKCCINDINNSTENYRYGNLFRTFEAYYLNLKEYTKITE